MTACLCRAFIVGFVGFVVIFAGLPSAHAASAFHSADVSRGKQISLSELLRVIQFFNIEGYHCADPPDSTEDGYVPGRNSEREECTPHDSDYSPQDWQVTLTELLRLIQFFNSAGYHVRCDTEDGFAPGPGEDDPCEGEEEPDGPPVVYEVSSNTTQTTNPTVTLSGLTSPDASVRVNGGANVANTVASSTGDFEVSVTLRQNQVNFLFVTARDNLGQESAPVTLQVLHDTQPPSLHIDFPEDGAVLTNEFITVAGRVSDILSGFMGLSVNVNDGPAAVAIGIGTNGTFDRPGVALELGPNVITAAAQDALGNVTQREITVTRVEPTGPRMTAVSGDTQSAQVYNRLAQPLVVQVTHPDGSPFAGKLVTFRITRSNGLLGLVPNDLDGRKRFVQVQTDENGEAAAYFWMGSDAGCGNNRVSVTSTDISGTAFFCATALPGPPSQINVGRGNNQRVEAGAPLVEPLRAWVNDACNGIANVPVTFTVTQGGGKVNGEDEVTVLTSATGHAEVDFVIGPDGGNNFVEATFPDNPGLPATFNAFGVPRREGLTTSFSGIVLDNAFQPIEGATAMLVVNNTTIYSNAVSNEQGQFRFDDIVAGPAQLFIDGLQAYAVSGIPVPPGSFPSLSYNLIVVPNAENSLPSPIQLPPLDPENAVVYDGTEDVVLTTKGIEGLEMIVRAGSMTRRDGTVPSPSNPQVLSLDQVQHDAVPMPMPDGVAPPFAWTLQPAGATFDPPVEVTYPNMSGLDPGAIAYFLSYNHDTEQFDIVASGSVSEDGSVITTDPGSGLTISGWGCNCPPYAVTGECEPCCETSKGQFTCEIPQTNELREAIEDQRNKIKFIQGQLDASLGRLRIETALALEPGQLSLLPLYRHCISMLGAGCATLPAGLSVCLTGAACLSGTFAVTWSGALIEAAYARSLLDQLRIARIELASLRAQETVRCRIQDVRNIINELLNDANTAIQSAQETLNNISDSIETINDAFERAEEIGNEFDRWLNLILEKDDTEVNVEEVEALLAELFLLEDVLELELQFTLDQLNSPTLSEVANPESGIVADLLSELDLSKWTIIVGGQTLTMNSDGTFTVSNISAPDQFGPEGPGSMPDFVSDDPVRLFAFREIDGKVEYAWTAPFQIVQGQTIFLRDDMFIFSDSPPPFPQSVTLDVPSPFLEAGSTAQLTTTGVLIDGSPMDFTPTSSGTTYRVSNTNVLTVDPAGVVTAHAPGAAFVTASNFGAVSVKLIRVVEESASTIVQGFVTLPDDGGPAAGAEVSTSFGSATADEQGFFELHLTVPADLQSLPLSVQWSDGPVVGSASRTLAVVPGGVTDAGILVLTLTDAGEAITWTGPDGGDWNDPENWSEGAVPQAGDTVLIDSPGEPVTVSIDSNTTWVNLNIVISNGQVRVEDGVTLTVVGDTRLEGALSLGDNSLLLAETAATTFEATGAVTMDGSRVQVRNGARVILPGLESYTINAPLNRVLFEVSGDGSELRLPNLAAVLLIAPSGTFPTFTVLAEDGGLVDLSGLTTVVTDGNAEFRAWARGEDSRVDLSALTQTGRTIIEVRNGGEVDISSAPAFGDDSEIYVQVGGVLTAPGLSELNASLRVAEDGTLALPVLETMTGSILVREDASLMLPVLETLGGSITVRANATLELPILETLGGSITVRANATLELPALEGLGGSITVEANASASLPSLVSVQHNITVAGGGVLDVPSLTTADTLTNSISLITVRGTGQLLAPELASMRNYRIWALDGAQVSLPGLTAYTWTINSINSTTNIFQASGPGAVLALPNLTDMLLDTSQTRTMTARAENGALVDLSGLTTVVTDRFARFRAWATGEDSLVDLSALTQTGRTTIEAEDGGEVDISSAPAFGDGSSIVVAVGGVVTAPGLSALNASLWVRENASFTLPVLETMTGSILVQDGGVLDVPSLTTADTLASNTFSTITVRGAGQLLAPQLASATNFRIHALDGAQVSLPALTAYTWTVNSTTNILHASGPGAVLALPNLTDMLLNYTGTRTVTVRAENGGLVDLSGLTTVVTDGGARFRAWATGEDSLVDLGALTQTGRTTIEADDGGEVDISSALAFGDESSIVVAVGGVITLPGLSALNVSLTVRENASLTLPVLETLGGSITMEAAATLELPALVSAGGVTVRSNASLTLPVLETMTGSILVLDGGVLDVPSLTTADTLASNTSSTITVRGAGQLLAPQLASATNFRINALDGAQMSLPGLTAYTWTVNSTTNILQASGPGAVLALPNLTSMQLDTPNNSTMTARAENGGLVDLSGLTTVVTDGGARFRAWATGEDSLVDLSALTQTGRTILVASEDGELEMPALLSASDLSIGEGSTLSLPALETVEGSISIGEGSTLFLPALETVEGSIDVIWNASASLASLVSVENNVTVLDGGVLDVPSLTTADTLASSLASVIVVWGAGQLLAPELASMRNYRIWALDGAQVSLPGLTAYTWTINSIDSTTNILQASGPGAVLALPNLTDMLLDTSQTRTMTARAENGALVDLSGLTTVVTDGLAQFRAHATGEDSLVDLSALVTFDPDRVTFLAEDGGVVLLPDSKDILWTNQEWTKTSASPVASALPVAAARADITGDGMHEWVRLDRDSGHLIVQDASGRVLSSRAVGAGPAAFVLADFDGDGLLDAAVLDLVSESVSVLFNAGSGIFYATEAYAVGPDPVALEATPPADDGALPGLVVRHAEPSLRTVLSNDGTGNFSVHLDDREFAGAP